MWLTKAVDISVSLLVHVVAYTVPSLRRPPVLLVHYRAIRGGEITGANGNHELYPHILASRLGGFGFDLFDRLFGHIKLLHVVTRQQSPLGGISRSTTIDDSIDRHQRPL